MEDCSICGENLKDQFSHTLECGHTFHYNCLCNSFKCLRLNNCPYCRRKNNYLPIINGTKKIWVGVHLINYDDFDIEDVKNINTNVKCNHILTRGKNKGCECGKKCKLGYDKCSFHSKNQNELVLFDIKKFDKYVKE